MEQLQGREPIQSSQKPTNPAAFFAEWSSTEKCWTFWDKASQSDVKLPMPFAFIPLYEMTTVKGYNHKENKSYWSNEVKNSQKDILTVMSKNNLTKEIKRKFPEHIQKLNLL